MHDQTQLSSIRVIQKGTEKEEMIEHFRPLIQSLLLIVE